MIAFIRGRLLEKHPNRVIVDVHGVGYEVQVPLSTFYEMSDPGTDVSFRVHTHVREDTLAQASQVRRGGGLADGDLSFEIQRVVDHVQIVVREAALEQQRARPVSVEKKAVAQPVEPFSDPALNARPKAG